MAHSDEKRIAKNATTLLAMNIAGMVFPLLTLPYLTRVLSSEMYGTLVYLRAVMGYMQTLVDFGFALSGTKDVAAAGDIRAIGGIVSRVVAAKLLLAVIAAALLTALTAFLPILQGAKALTALFYLEVVASIFLIDFLFRGLEKMEMIALRYAVMKGISTALTFVFVHSDADVLCIPLLELLGTAAGMDFVAFSVRRLGVKLVRPSLSQVGSDLKKSAVYFASTAAATSFSALNTLWMGMMFSPSEIAQWGVCMQMIAAIQSLYTPITNSIYPAMVHRRERKMLKKAMRIFMPMVTVGCAISYWLAPWALKVVGGMQYAAATPIFRALIPILFFGFPAILYGWPALGAIGREKENALTTVGSLMFQGVGLIALMCANCVTLLAVACVRSAAEAVLCVLRVHQCHKFRSEFADGKDACKP